MIGRAAVYIATGVIGTGLGVSSALYMAGLWPGMKPLDFGDVEIDGWRSDFAIGSTAADPYTRARVARHGLLALAKTEAVYFTRSTDDSGQPLTEECTYRLSMGNVPAGWWSVTLYDSESFLPDNTDGAHSVNAYQDVIGQVGDQPLGKGLTATVASKRPAEGLWISSRNAGDFDLTLRLYMPEPELLNAPQSALEPPKVERLSCQGDA